MIDPTRSDMADARDMAFARDVTPAGDMAFARDATTIHGRGGSRTPRKPVGITKGPGETTHEYTFVSRDDEQQLKNGEYVYYELTDADLDTNLDEAGLNGRTAVARRVLGRVLKRVPLQLYPDTFLAEPEISPTQVAAMVGYDSRTNELF